MFPNHFNNYQGMMPMMFMRIETDEQRERRERRRKEEIEADRQAIMHLTYCCLNMVGLVLSKCGKMVESAGQRVTWYAMSKKAENAPWHYH